MKKELRFIFCAIKKNMQGSAELRISFFANVIGMAINNIAFMITLMYFVQSVGVIHGWTQYDVIGLLGFGAFTYGLVFSFGAGLRRIAEYVANGSFDRYILSPKNILIRVAVSSFGASAVGDIVFGVICLFAYGILTHLFAHQIMLLCGLVVIATITQLSVVIAIYAMSFFFSADAQLVTSGLFDLFLTPTLFHGGSFQGILRFVFTFLIPSLVVGALPVEIVRDVSWDMFCVLAVLSFLWFFFSLMLFKIAMRRYESSNLMTFGG